MKKFLVLFFILAFASLIYAANTDVYNVGTKINLNTEPQTTLTNAANACASYETATSITYIFKSTVTTDSSNQRHSLPFFIADCNDVDAYCRAIVSAASDVNVYYHFSYDDRKTWYQVTPATLDATSNTAKGDTLGIEAGVNDAAGLHTGLWLIVEIDGGGTTCNLGEVVTWTAEFTKDAYFTNQAGAWTPLAKIANSSNTNP